MATVIDAFIVTLGMNAKGFTQGAQEVGRSLKKTTDETASAAKSMEASGKQAAMFFSKVRNEALALLAVFTAGVGLKNFTANTITGATSLGQMSQNLSMSTERLSAWQRAAERAGGSAEGITAQLKESANQVAKFKRGMAAETLPAFFQYGGKVDDLKDGNTYLLARSRIISELYKTDRARAALAAQQMGISDEQFDLLKQGPAAIQQLVAAQEKRSSLSEKDTQAAKRLREMYLDLRDTFSAVGTKVLIALIPAFERLLKAAQRMGDYVLEHRQDIVNWVDRAVTAIGKFVDIADKAAQSVGGWTNVLLALGGLKLLSMVSPLLSLAGALTGIATSLGLIGGVSGAAGITALGALGVAAGGIALATYSKNLNAGEKEQVSALNNPEIGSDKAKGAVRLFESKGYTREQAIGLVANLQAESGLNHKAVGDNGQAYGIGQWHPNRQADFKKAFGLDIRDSTYDQQLQFVAWELMNTESTARKKLLETKTPQDAAKAGRKYYERPDPKNAERDDAIRVANAGALYAAIFRDDKGPAGAGKPPQTATSGPVSEAALSAGAISAIATAAQAASATNNTTSNTTSHSSTTETNINGPITIQSSATDGQGIARDLAGLGKNQTNVAQSNTGLF